MKEELREFLLAPITISHDIARMGRVERVIGLAMEGVLVGLPLTFAVAESISSGNPIQGVALGATMWGIESVGITLASIPSNQ